MSIRVKSLAPSGGPNFVNDVEVAMKNISAGGYGFDRYAAVDDYIRRQDSDGTYVHQKDGESPDNLEGKVFMMEFSGNIPGKLSFNIAHKLGYIPKRFEVLETFEKAGSDDEPYAKSANVSITSRQRPVHLSDTWTPTSANFIYENFSGSTSPTRVIMRLF